jgi:hypothetical protein
MKLRTHGVWCMWESIKKAIVGHLTVEKLVPIVVTAVISSLTVGILGHGCHLVGASLSNVAVSPGGVVALKGKTTVQVQAVQRQTVPHTFLFFGHVHYATTYQIGVTNVTVDAGQTAVLEISSKEGHLVTFTAPPLIKPRLTDGTPAAEWSRKLDDEGLKQLGVEIEMPPQGVRVTLTVIIDKIGQYVADRDLLVTMRCGNTFIQEQAAAVKWANK